MKWKFITGIASAVLVLLLAVIYVILSGYNYNSLKPEIVRAVKDATGRDLKLGGDISLKVGFTPALVLKDVSFQNASWGSQPEMVKVKRFEIKVSLLPLISHRVEVKRLVLIQPEILLETDNSGNSNLAFETGKREELTKTKDVTKAGDDWKISSLTFNELDIENGFITSINRSSKKTYTVKIDTLTATATSNESPVKLKCTGAYSDMPFEVTGALCPPTAFVNPSRAWPVNLVVKIENVILALDGTVKDPLAGRSIELNFSLKCKDLANLKQLFGEASYLRGPLDISGKIADSTRNVYSFSNLKVIQGDNDFGGSAVLNLTENRPKIIAELSVKKLDFRSGIKSGAGNEKTTTEPDRVSRKKDKIFSDRQLPLDILRHADADIKIRAVQILLPNRPVSDIEMGIMLKDGALTVKPLRAVLGKGFMDGYLSVQSKGKVAAVAIILKINKADIGYFTKEIKGAEAIEGNLDIDIDLNARGSSISGLMGGLNGRTVLVMGKGRINNKYINILGGDIATGLLHLLNPFRNEKQHTTINCFVNGFNIKDGVATTTALALNTDRMVVVGEGDINLKTERLNISLKPVPKKGEESGLTGKLTGNLSELARPFKLGGTLADPSLAVDPTQTAIVVGKLLGGTTLFGPAGIAAALIGGNSDDENSCVSAISAAKKGVRAKKSSAGGEVSKGAEQIFKDAGKGLNKLFGR